MEKIQDSNVQQCAAIKSTSLGEMAREVKITKTKLNGLWPGSLDNKIQRRTEQSRNAQDH
jgi:hypothetical protein